MACSLKANARIFHFKAKNYTEKLGLYFYELCYDSQIGEFKLSTVGAYARKLGSLSLVMRK
jgi:hypothetical protein